jgi:uridine phosphorylase
MTFLTPRGAEAAAVRKGAPEAWHVEIPAGAAAAAALPKFAADESVIVMGLCGAVGGLEVGDVVVYDAVRDERIDVRGSERLTELLLDAVPGAHRVNAWTAGHVVTTLVERRKLAAHGADVVDMEGTALSLALQLRGVAFGTIRVVSDDATRDLPALADVIAPDGTLRIGVLLRAFAADPPGAFAFIRDAQKGLARLREVAALLARTPL